jgi:very-short-patch-repair endonuclease
MHELDALFDGQGGVATTGQLRRLLTRRQLESRANHGDVVKLWSGVYGRGEVDDVLRLRGLDLRAGVAVPVCLGTAARAYGFDTEDVVDLHVLNPDSGQLRRADGLVVHRRDGAPLAMVDGRPATAPAWTAVEVARALRRPRAIATLDAALRSGWCDRRDLTLAAMAQAGRRGIVAVRDLVPLADAAAESPMESEARLMMIDGSLPMPELQFEVIDRSGRLWRLDFAWPGDKFAVEYDGFDFHSDPDALTRDRQKRAALSELDWNVMSIVSDDVRRRPYDTVRRIEFERERARAA